MNFNSNFTRYIGYCQANNACSQIVLLMLKRNSISSGMGFSKRSLIRQLDYSETTIRDSLQKLRKDGLIIYRTSNKTWCLNPSYLEKDNSLYKFTKDVKIAGSFQWKEDTVMLSNLYSQ